MAESETPRQPSTGDELYSLSTRLRRSVRAAASKVGDLLPERPRLVEYITLPDYEGRVILRFDVAESVVASLEQADTLEAKIRSLLGDHYWAVLIGAVYRRLGVVVHALPERLGAIDRALPASASQPTSTVHSDLLRQDGETVRTGLNLTPEARVWEVEVPVVEVSEMPIIRIVDTREHGEGLSSQRPFTEIVFGATRCRVEFMKNNRSFSGLYRAYVAAERQGVGLVSFIARFQDAAADL